MELSYLIFTGALSGVISALGHSVAWSAVSLLQSPPQARTFASSTTIEVLEILLHLCAGALLGLLFWLSWGLAAVVDVAWWVRGVSFGSLCWLALALPVTVSLALTQRVSATSAASTASRWATTCIIAGLSCAWSWDRAV
jgi:uncharacterized membrane protein (Fun14 family)